MRIPNHPQMGGLGLEVAVVALRPLNGTQKKNRLDVLGQLQWFLTGFFEGDVSETPPLREWRKAAGAAAKGGDDGHPIGNYPRQV